VARRLGGRCPDAGAYAILYALLVVVLVGMGAVVVDFASVRQDRRLDRSAADSAVVAGTHYLNNNGSGANPYQACLSAWSYLDIALNISTPAGACNTFSSYQTAAAVSAYCAAASPAEIDDVRTVGDRTIRVGWPIPYHVGGTISEFLTPELAPGSTTQTFNAAIDGTDAGCDRLGVALIEAERFGLGGALGASGTQTQVHSVARFNPDGGPTEGIAALNILNPTDCGSLITTGGGKVLVGPVMSNGTPIGPGTIAVEADGSTSTCNGGKKVIAPTTGSGSQICASSVIIVVPSDCDGKGIVLAHALDGSFGANTYSSAATAGCPPGGNLCPVPSPEGGTYRWNPVTKRFGCNTTNLNPCQIPAVNHVAALESAYGGAGLPSTVYAGQPPYVNPYPGVFNTVPASVCANITTTLYLTPGNWYANCSINIKNGGALIIQGGNLVADGDIAIASGGAFVANTAVTTVPVAVSGSGSTVTTPVPPSSDEIIFLRNGTIDNSGTLVMPQTFVYSKSSTNHPVNVNGTVLTLWTAPGAGALNGSGRTTLEQACFDSSTGTIVEACMFSRFSRLVYWSDYPAPSTKPNNFAGQGALAVIGVFFTPRGYFNFTGGGSYTAAAAQFWADQLNVNGGANLGLVPESKFSVEAPLGAVNLIR
jgi:hypothetical protein